MPTANAGGISVVLQALGGQKFSSTIQGLIDRLKKMKDQAGAGSSVIDTLRDKMKSADSSAAGFAQSASRAAAAMGAISAVTQAFGMAKAANDAERAKAVFEGLGGSLESLRTTTQGMVSDANLAKRANLAETMGIGGDDFKRLSEIALAAAAKTGQSVEYMFDSIIVGTARQSKLILDNLGIIVNVDKANQDYAATLGKSSDALSDNEKKQAFMTATLAAGNRVMKQVAATGVSLANPFDQFTASLQNISGIIGTMLIPFFGKLFQHFSVVNDAVKEAGSLWARLNPTVKNTIVTVGAAALAFVTVAVSVGALVNATAIIGRVFLSVAVSAATMVASLIPIIAIVAGIAAIAGIVRVAWEENWGGIRDTARIVWNEIVGFVGRAADTIIAVIAAMGMTAIDILFALPMAIASVMDMMLGMVERVIGAIADTIAGLGDVIASLVGSFPNIAERLGLDPESAKKFGSETVKALQGISAGMRAQEATGGFAGQVKDAKDTFGELFQPKSFKDLIDTISGSDVVKNVIEGLGEAGKGLLITVGDGLKLILKDLGIDVDTLFGPAARQKKAGAGVGGAAADSISEAMNKARKDWRHLMQDMQFKLDVSTAGISGQVFGDLKNVSVELQKEFRTLQEKANAAGVSSDEGMRLARKNAAFALAGVVSQVQSADEFAKALEFARIEAMRLGVDFKEVQSDVKFKPQSLADVLTGPIGKIFDQLARSMGAKFDAGDRKEIIGGLSQGLESLFQGGGVGADVIGKLFGQLMGGSGILAKAAGLMGAGGGIAGMLGGPAGGAIGAAIGTAASAVAPIVIDAIQNIMQSIVSAFKAFPELVSGLIEKAASIIPEDRFKAAISNGFNPMIVSIGMVTGALVALSAPALMIASVLLVAVAPALVVVAASLLFMVPAIILVVAAFGTILAVLALVAGYLLATVTFVMGVFTALMTVIYTTIGVFIALFTPIGHIVVLLAGAFVPVLAAATIALGLFAAVAATVVGVLGLFMVFLKLASETKSFEQFKKAFEGSIDRIVQALEPFFNGLLPLVGLFDALISVVIPLAQGFANNEMAARLLFEGVKMAAIAMALFVYAIALVVTVLLEAVMRMATGFADMIDSSGFLQTAINGLADALFRSGEAMLAAILRTFGDLMPQSMRDILAGMQANLAGQVGRGQAAQQLSSTLRNLAGAASAMRPDLNAMGDAITELTGLSYDEARQRAEILAMEKDSGESMQNVPSGYKVALRRFQNIFDEMGDFGEEAAGRGGTGDHQGAGGSGPGALLQGVIAPINIATMNIMTPDPQATGEHLRQMAERKEMAKSGRADPIRDFRYNGP